MVEHFFGAKAWGCMIQFDVHIFLKLMGQKLHHDHLITFQFCVATQCVFFDKLVDPTLGHSWRSNRLRFSSKFCFYWCTIRFDMYFFLTDVWKAGFLQHNSVSGLCWWNSHDWHAPKCSQRMYHPIPSPAGHLAKELRKNKILAGLKFLGLENVG